MKKDMDDVTEKLGVNKDEVSSSDKQGKMAYMLILMYRYHQFQKISFLDLSSRMYRQTQGQISAFILKTKQKISNSYCLML